MTTNLKLLRNGWLLVAALVIAGGLGAFVASKSREKEYTATTRLFVSVQAGATATDLLQSSTFAQQRVKSYADVVTTRAVLAPVAARFGRSAKELAANVSATVPIDTVLIGVAVKDSSPQQAALIANAIGAEFRRVVTTLEIPASEGGSSVRVTQVQGAIPPSAPSAPNNRNAGIFGALLGLIAGWGILLARDRLDTRIRVPADLDGVTTLPVLGTTSKLKRGPSESSPAEGHPATVHAEAYRQIRTNLQFLRVDDPPRVVLVTSALAGEGKSTVTTNTAVALSETGARVVIVDADLRRPAASSYLGVSTPTGLTSVLRRDTSLDDALVTWGSTGLQVLSAGPVPPNPSELLGSDAMANLLEQLKAQFEYVIIDTPPVLPVTDAVVLATKADGVIIVCRSQRVSRTHLRDTIERLSNVGGRVLGLVLSGVPSKGREGYDSYYGSYTSTTADTETRG